jgi:hypothetical protein
MASGKGERKAPNPNPKKNPKCFQSHPMNYLRYSWYMEEAFSPFTI